MNCSTITEGNLDSLGRIWESGQNVEGFLFSPPLSQRVRVVVLSERAGCFKIGNTFERMGKKCCVDVSEGQVHAF